MEVGLAEESTLLLLGWCVGSGNSDDVWSALFIPAIDQMLAKGERFILSGCWTRVLERAFRVIGSPFQCL